MISFKRFSGRKGTARELSLFRIVVASVFQKRGAPYFFNFGKYTKLYPKRFYKSTPIKLISSLIRLDSPTLLPITNNRLEKISPQ